MDLFRVQIGSVPLDATPDGVANVLTIVRVVHVPSGRQRLVKRMGEETVQEVITGLQEEILEELRRSKRLEQILFASMSESQLPVPSRSGRRDGL
jgi:hypothetical protein